jgi:polyisoprenoid-binding protein YceI
MLVGLWLRLATARADDAVPEAPPAPAARTWALDAARSWLYVVVYFDPDRFTPITAHDHTVRATSFQGSVRWDTNDVSACAIDISFPVTALRVDVPGGREREGLPADGAISDDDKVTVVKNMLSKSNLYGDQFPSISFKSASCAAAANGKVAVTGDLSIRGVAKRVTVPMAITASESAFAAKGTFELTHADFGMSPFTYGPLTPKNLERLKFVVDVVGK